MNKIQMSNFKCLLENYLELSRFFLGLKVFNSDNN